MNKVMLRSNLTFVCAVFTVLTWGASWQLLDNYYPWRTFYHDFVVFLGVFFLFGFMTVSQLFSTVVIPRLFLVLLAVSIIPWIQYGFGIIYFLGDAFISHLYLLGFAFAFLIGRNQGEYNLSPFCTVAAIVLLSSACVSVVLALLQFLQLESGVFGVLALSDHSSRAYANLAQPNNLATLLLLGGACLCYLHETKRFGSITFLSIWFFVCLGIAVTQSRTPLIGLVFLVAWWFLGRYKCQLQSLTIQKIIGMVAIFITAQYLAAAVAEGLLINNEVGSLRPSSARIYFWWQMAHAILDFRWLGYGWNQVGMAQSEVVFQYALPVPAYFEHSHNILLDILVWNGPFLGTVIVGVAAFYLFSLYTTCTTKEGWVALLAIGFLLIHGMLELPLEYAYFLLPLGIFLGIAFSQSSVLSESRRLVIPWYVHSSLLVLFAAGLVFVWGEYRYVEARSTHVRMVAKQIYIPPSEVVHPRYSVFTQLTGFLSFMQQRAQEGMSIQAIDEMKKVARRFPTPPVLFRYGLALGLNDKILESKKELERLKLLHGQEMYDEALNNMAILSKKYPQLTALLN